MSDGSLDELAEAARNRGLKLVRSRVRTVGKKRFGKVGLTDKSGKPVFGMDAKGAIGTPEDAEEYLRNLGAKDWGASLNVAVLPRKKKSRREAANDSEPEVEPKAAPEVGDGAVDVGGADHHVVERRDRALGLRGHAWDAHQDDLHAAGRRGLEQHRGPNAA